MKKTLLLVSCFSVMSNCYALKSNYVSTYNGSSSSSSTDSSSKKFLEARLGPDSKGRFYTRISTYNKKSESDVNNLAVEIANFVCNAWRDREYNMDTSTLSANIKNAAPQYLKKWKRHYLYVSSPKKSDIKNKKLSVIQSFLKKDSSGINGRVWTISDNTPGAAGEYIVEMAAKHNIFKDTGKNITFNIYKGDSE